MDTKTVKIPANVVKALKLKAVRFEPKRKKRSKEELEFLRYLGNLETLLSDLYNLEDEMQNYKDDGEDVPWNLESDYEEAEEEFETEYYKLQSRINKLKNKEVIKLYKKYKPKLRGDKEKIELENLLSGIEELL